MKSDNPYAEITTLEQFEELLLPQASDALLASVDTELDLSELRFVMYVRKSTVGKERQERSIPDQLADCEQLSQRLGLNVVEVVKERQSAKEPGIRPKFRKMLEDLKAEKFDAVISWHPDRLARNMKEAGEIIDMLDRKIIKHIAFATYSFENNPTGKMLLGISFVLSKQYSDHLSENVRRGQRRSTGEGRYLGPQKHGYYKHEGRLYPDERNFQLIKNGFAMRLDGKTNVEIAKYLNANHYTVKRTSGEREFKMTDKRVGEFLKDPAYIGIVFYGDFWINLAKLYDFQPMIEVEDFLKINATREGEIKMLGSDFLLSQRHRDSTKIRANFLRGMVKCGFCTNPMSSGITSTTKKGIKIHRYYYRCDTPGCQFENKSARPKYILDFVYDFLENNHFTTQAHYDHYANDARLRIVELNLEDTDNANYLQRVLIEQKKGYQRVKEIMKTNDPDIVPHYKGELDNAQAEVKATEKDIKRLNSQIQERKDSVLTYEQYLELYGNVSVKLRQINGIELKDEIIKKFFSNFTITGHLPTKKQGITRWEVTGYTLNEPFADFVKMGNILDGRGDRT